MENVKIIYINFPENLKDAEYAKDGDVIFKNLSFETSSSTSIIVPLSALE